MIKFDLSLLVKKHAWIRTGYTQRSEQKTYESERRRHGEERENRNEGQDGREDEGDV